MGALGWTFAPEVLLPLAALTLLYAGVLWLWHHPALQSSPLALVLSFYPRVIYESYARAARVSSFLPLEDQAWGGIMMWAGGAAVDMSRS